MEQIIEVFGIDWRVLIVQFINFSLLLGVLWYFLYTPLTTLIEKRRAQIIEGVANAERAETALKDADSKRADILAKAAKEAQEVLTAARQSGKEREAVIVAEAKARSEHLLREAELKGKEIERESLLKSKEQVAKLVVLGMERSLRESRT